MQTFNSCSWPHKSCPADIVLQHSCCQIQRPPAAVVNYVPPQSDNARMSQYAGSGRMLWAKRSLDCCTNALSGALRPVAALPGELEFPVDDSHLPATSALLSLPRRRITRSSGCSQPCTACVPSGGGSLRRSMAAAAGVWNYYPLRFCGQVSEQLPRSDNRRPMQLLGMQRMAEQQY